MGGPFWSGDDDLSVVRDEGVELAHEPNEGSESEKRSEDRKGMGDHLEQAVDAIAYLAGDGIDEGDLVDGALAVDHRTSGLGYLLVGGTTGLVEHAGSREGAGIYFTHGTFGVVEDDVVF